MQDTANTTRDRVTWESESLIELNTCGSVLIAISGILGLIAIVGCLFIASATQNSQILMYICGIIWLIPFGIAGVLLGRFRHSLFVRLRGMINGFLGGGL